MGRTLDLFKAVFKKKVGIEDAKPQGPAYPFGLAVGKTVKLDETPFMIGEGQLMLPFPGERCTVIGISTYELHGRKVQRFYLEAEPTDSNKDVNREYILELSQEKTDGPIDLCRLYWVRIEETPDDYAPFLDRDGIMWGPEIQIPQTFDPDCSDKIVYTTVWGNGAEMEPLAYREHIIGGNTINFPHANLFGRKLGLPTLENEYLLMAVVEDSDGAFLQGIVGIDIDKTSITVL